MWALPRFLVITIIISTVDSKPLTCGKYGLPGSVAYVWEAGNDGKC